MKNNVMKKVIKKEIALLITAAALTGCGSVLESASLNKDNEAEVEMSLEDNEAEDSQKESDEKEDKASKSGSSKDDKEKDSDDEDVKEEEEDDEALSADASWDDILSGDAAFEDEDGNVITINELLDKDTSDENDILYTFSDVDGDGEDELYYRTRVDSYVINKTDDGYAVIYVGAANYERPVSVGETHGLYYFREGAAPTRREFKFTEIDDSGEVLNIRYSAMIDVNEDGKYDENDEYYLDEGCEEEIDYDTWMDSSDNLLWDFGDIIWLDSKVKEIDWSQNMSDFPFFINFTLNDGTVVEANTGIVGLSVDTMYRRDIDNDGEYEYVFPSYYANTLGEHFVIFAFKLEGDEMELIFPGTETGIEEIDNNDVMYALDTVISVDGHEKTAIRVESYHKDNGEAVEDFIGIIYYEDGTWYEFEE